MLRYAKTILRSINCPTLTCQITTGMTIRISWSRYRGTSWTSLMQDALCTVQENWCYSCEREVLVAINTCPVMFQATIFYTQKRKRGPSSGCSALDTSRQVKSLIPTVYLYTCYINVSYISVMGIQDHYTIPSNPVIAFSASVHLCLVGKGSTRRMWEMCPAWLVFAACFWSFAQPGLCCVWGPVAA